MVNGNNGCDVLAVIVVKLCVRQRITPRQCFVIPFQIRTRPSYRRKALLETLNPAALPFFTFSRSVISNSGAAGHHAQTLWVRHTSSCLGNQLSVLQSRLITTIAVADLGRRLCSTGRRS